MPRTQTIRIRSTKDSPTVPTHKAVDWTGVLTADPGKRSGLAGDETPSTVCARRRWGDVDEWPTRETVAGLS